MAMVLTSIGASTATDTIDRAPTKARLEPARPETDGRPQEGAISLGERRQFKSSPAPSSSAAAALFELPPRSQRPARSPRPPPSIEERDAGQSGRAIVSANEANEAMGLARLASSGGTSSAPLVAANSPITWRWQTGGRPIDDEARLRGVAGATLAGATGPAHPSLAQSHHQLNGPAHCVHRRTCRQTRTIGSNATHSPAEKSTGWAPPV